LEQGELVQRRREGEFPYHVTYQLMPAARELLVVIVPVVEWAESHGDLLSRVQQRRHDEASGIA
jgi:DNA-binding HxlR family transcriptional regulator